MMTRCLYGVEVKFYNMEVDIDEHLESPYKGLYMIGDGSGVTHSLSHASASGVYVARRIAQEGAINKKARMSALKWKRGNSSRDLRSVRFWKKRADERASGVWISRIYHLIQTYNVAQNIVMPLLIRGKSLKEAEKMSMDTIEVARTFGTDSSQDRASSPADSSSVWRLRGRLSGIRRCRSQMSRPVRSIR